MTDTEKDLHKRIAERAAYLAPLIEEFEKMQKDVMAILCDYVSRIRFPRIPDYKTFRI